MGKSKKKTTATKTTEPAPAITVGVKILERDIRDLLISGFEGGVGYWACIIEHKVPEGMEEPEYAYAVLPLVQGGAIILADAEKVPRHGDVPANVTRWVLDREAIMKGLNIMAEKYPFHFGNFIADNADAETGDVFIQCCVLGDIVYG